MPLAYFLHSAGPAAAPVRLLRWALAALCVGVCIAIAVLLVLAMRRPGSRVARARTGEHAVVDNTGDRDAHRIVAIGTAISTVLLLGALVAMLRVLAAVADPPRAAASRRAERARHSLRLVVEGDVYDAVGRKATKIGCQ
ncbi:hypothetical protein [Paraburkholderia sp. Ac-20347]|uniref:hypothetical protein n=1 Tax=Paraburkholderia sp. Ac-20347 TaxID=2703892 RepID=UPI0019807F87|nr:hypothetical protein [Paraburkholderia sp. Ac-20347]